MYQFLQETLKAFWAYLVSIADALSQLAGRITTWTDNPNESISGAAWRKRHQYPMVRIVIDFLLRPLGPDHCRGSFMKDWARARIMVAQHDPYRAED